MAIISVSMQMA